MKIDRQMLVYGIEYSVMHDETFLAYLADPRYQKLSKQKPGRSQGSFDENQEGVSPSPTPSSHGSDEDSLYNNNVDDAKQDFQALATYVTSLEQKLRLLGEEPKRPNAVDHILAGHCRKSEILHPLTPTPSNTVLKSSDGEGNSCQT